MRGFIPTLPRFLVRRGPQLSTRTLPPITVCFVKSVVGRKTGHDETSQTSFNVLPGDIILSRSVTLLEKENAGRRRDFTVTHFLHPVRARSVKDSPMESTNRSHRHL
jgi:hypothetical protein